MLFLLFPAIFVQLKELWQERIVQAIVNTRLLKPGLVRLQHPVLS